MTTDEMVADIRALYEAMHGRDYPHEVDTRLECGTKGTVAKHGSYGAFATTTAEALGGLRVKLRDAASKALAEHEAKAETLRKALGIVEGPDAATCAQLDAVRRYIAARNAYEDGKMRPMGQKASRAYDELLDATATLRAVMGGAL
jgi:hypothetical protein